MKASPYGSSYSMESEDMFAHRDAGNIVNPERNQILPIRSNIQSAYIDYDETSGGSSYGGHTESYPSNERGIISSGMSPVHDWRRNRAEMEGRMRNHRGNGEGYGYLNPKYLEGRSNHFDDTVYGRSKSPNNEFDVPKSFEHLERDRAELLRKLNELEDQLVRSGSVGEQRKQPDPFQRNMYGHESYGSSNDWFRYNSSISSTASIMADKPATNPSYHSRYPEKHPYTERNDAAMGSSHISTSSPNNITRHGTYVDPQMPRRAPIQYQQYYSHHTSSPVEFIDAVDTRSPLHRPDCPCVYCYNNGLKSSPQVQTRNSVNSRFTETPGNPKFDHQSCSPVVGQPGYSSPKSNPSIGMGGVRKHTRWPAEVDSNYEKHVESMAPARVRRNIRLIAGGAPFVTCRHCFELLQLPLKILRIDKHQQKIRCAACSYYMYCIVKGKKLVVSVNEEMKAKSKEIEYASNMEEAKENLKELENVSNQVMDEIIHARGPRRTSKSFQSDDSDSAVYEEGKGETEELTQNSISALEETKEHPKVVVYSSIKATDEVLHNHGSTSQAIESYQSDGCSRDKSKLIIKQPNSVASLASNSNRSLSASSSEDDNVEECLTTQGEVADGADNGSTLSPSSDGSDQEEQHGYSPSDHAVYWFGTRSQIRRAKYAAKVSKKSTSHKFFAKEVAAETEIQLSYKETPDTDISLDSESGKRDEIPPRMTMDDYEGSFLAENMKNSCMEFGKLSQAVDAVKWDVSINEHPIPDHLVKKAEDVAGPIKPGSYWYDFRVGFWGVMGGPCLGIIPPHIKEFDYPISKNCSGGTTGIIVNGRELHKKDLVLLESRGLPADRNKSYTIELSGRVIDKDSGEELKCLGPLAPTIARLKRGFGMRTPRHLLQVHVDGGS